MTNRTPALLALEDGTTWPGVALGAIGERAGLADMPHQRACVHAADPDDAMLAQVVVQRCIRAPVAHARAGGAHHKARKPGLGALLILQIHAGVADMRRGHHHDLAVVGGVGQHLLIAGHGGVEDYLAGPLTDRAKCRAGPGAAVLKRQQRGDSIRHGCRSPGNRFVINQNRRAARRARRGMHPERVEHGPRTDHLAARSRRTSQSPGSRWRAMPVRVAAHHQAACTEK